ncbi:unnamed protein product [Cylicocyclus nassatus]|uniref:Uncharacterized protein n=1 Tax=Cylicocyclus nassatus TaxID=53992 RepID=A0AA36GN34_CYLNA|nr:unnamed protein product [Cylicocyclus nassatus]
MLLTIVDFIICLMFNSTVTSEIIAYIAEEDDLEAPVILQHLNMSRMYHSYKLKVDDVIVEHIFVMNGTPSNKFSKSISKADLLISICKSEEGRQLVIRSSQEAGIPTVHIIRSSWTSIDDQIIGKASKNQIFLVPTLTVFNNAILDILPSLDILPNTTVLFERAYGNMESVQEVFGRLPVPMDFVQIEEDPKKRQEQIKNVVESGRVIIVAETALVVMLVRELQLSEMAEETPSLIVFTKDITPFRCDECNSTDLFWIRPYATGSPNMRFLRDFISAQFGSELNYSTKAWEEVEIAFYLDVMRLVLETLTRKRSNTTLSSISKDVTYVFADVLDVLNNSMPQFGGYKQFDATATIFYQNILAKVIRTERTSDHPEETYNKEIASWTTVDKLTLLYDSLDIDIKTIETYRIVTAAQEPFIQLSEDPDKPFEGYCIDLIELIREELNFTYTIYGVEDGSFGEGDQNGNWDGIIGALLSGSADIALGPISVTAERENVVDFTVPYYDLVGNSILMRKPEVKHSLFKFMQVLEWPVWVCIVAAYIVMSIALWLFDRISPYSYTNNKKK